MMKKRWFKSVITQRIIKSIQKIGLTCLGLCSILSLGQIQPTNSFFINSETSSGNTMAAGYWIPTLEMRVNPASPDGEDGFYKTAPCVTLTADINGETDGIKIYYEFSEDGDPVSGGTVYGSTCVLIPDGNPIHFQAQAVNEDNGDWKSSLISADFKVDTAPEEKTVEAGDVVINEVMWMGSKKDNGDAKSYDEWIELRNMTGHDIDIKNWNISGAVSGGGGHLEIAASPEDDFVIPAHGYFVIANYSKSDSLIDEDIDLVKASINFDNDYDDNGQIVLKDKDGNVIDSAPDADDRNWPKGKNESVKKWSMERNLSPKDGGDGDSWHTCDREIMSASDLEKMKGYWDDNAQNYNCGTPGHANLSKNDRTAEDFDPVVTVEKEKEVTVVEIPPVLESLVLPPAEPIIDLDPEEGPPKEEEMNQEKAKIEEILDKAPELDPAVIQ